MTFEEWYETAPPDVAKDAFKACWDAAWEDGRRTGVSAQVGWQDYLDRYDD